MIDLRAYMEETHPFTYSVDDMTVDEIAIMVDTILNTWYLYWPEPSNQSEKNTYKYIFLKRFFIKFYNIDKLISALIERSPRFEYIIKCIITQDIPIPIEISNLLTDLLSHFEIIPICDTFIYKFRMRCTKLTFSLDNLNKLLPFLPARGIVSYYKKETTSLEALCSTS